MNAVASNGVADCVRSHTAWMTAQARLSPHHSWDDGPLHWTWSADGRSLHGVFPDETPPDVVARGVEAADALGAVEVSAWSAVDVVKPELEALGFQAGWRPCWMSAATAGFDPGPALLSRRAGLSVRARRHEAHLQPLLARDDTWRAEARSGSRYAGRAWLHVTGDVAGLYDMAHAASPTSRVSSPCASSFLRRCCRRLPAPPRHGFSGSGADPRSRQHV